VLIDGHALLYRAFFGFPQSLTTKDGQLVNAAYGFTRIALSGINELKPTHLAVSFDVGKTFRHEAFEAYKAHREKMPDEMKSQEPIIQEILNDLNIPIYSVQGYEADDVIGTVAKQETRNEKQETNVLIITGDKDMWQLVDEHIGVYVPAMNKRPSRVMDREGVKTSLGVYPEQVPDYKGLAGDSSDNIPGVKGVGPKTAVELISTYGSLENLYEHVDEVKGSVGEKLKRDKEIAIQSKSLATIITNVPLEFDWDHCKVTTYDKNKAIEVFEKYGFKSLIPALPVDTFEEAVQEALF
jgi:DNA polymerase-1